MIIDGKLFKYFDNTGKIIRVIHVEEAVAYFIDTSKDTCLPRNMRIDKVVDEIESGVLQEIEDIFLRVIDEKDIDEKERNKRDESWKIIDLLWNQNREVLLIEKNRKNRIIEITEQFGISYLQVKRLLTRFFKKGMTKNALLRDYSNTGVRGADRKIGDKKIGRPRNVSYYGDESTGIAIDSEIKKIFEVSIERFYLKKQKPTLKYAYDCMLKEFFSYKVHVNGEIVHKKYDEDKIPTYRQFLYWFNKKKDFKKNIIAREGEKNFQLKYRELLGNSTMETDGPGSRFQIDATIADVYLVSEYDRNRIIGRPIVYAIIDVYSRLITGMYVGLEGPSWMGAMMALDNMIADKVEFCSEYGIEITEEQWPSKHIPEIIIADRGEFEGYSPEGLINNLGIKIENTSPYRGDLKGIVERHFGTTNMKIKHQTPGAILKEYRKRGDRDYRLDATLTLKEFIKIYINMVLRHNNKIIDGYPLEKEALKDNISPIPIMLWDWGIKNKKGRLRTVSRDTLRLNILPKGKATISRAGLKFKGMYYSSKKAIEEQYFVNPKSTKVQVVYDPRNIEHVYILNSDGLGYEKFNLIEKSGDYRGAFLEEIVFMQEIKRELDKLRSHDQKQLDVQLQESIENIVKKAKKERAMESGRNIESNAKKLKGIRVNRAVEKSINRKDESFQVGEEEKKEDAVVLEVFSRKEESGSGEKSQRYTSLMEKLKKKRDEKIGRS